MSRAERRPTNTSRKTKICRRFRYMLERPKLRAETHPSTVSQKMLVATENVPSTYLMYGRKAKERKNPDTKPQMCAKLSIQGSRPKEKKNVQMANNLENALHGRSRICQLCKSSTNRQDRMPNWLPAGPTWEQKGFLSVVETHGNNS